MEMIKKVFLNKKIRKYLVVILWMALIFYLSSQPAEKSNNLSKRVTKIIIATAEKISPSLKLSLSRMNHIVRKSAHFIIFMALGILTINMLETDKKFNTEIVIKSLILCVIYAVFDELHQLFVSGRGAQVKDVVIDAVGSTAGILIYIIRKSLLKKTM